MGSTPIQSGWWKKSSDSANPIGAMEAVDVLLKGWVERLQGLRRIHWGTPSEEPTKLEAKHGESWGKISKVSRILGGEVLAWFVFFGIPAC